MTPKPIGLLGIPTRLARVTRTASQVVHSSIPLLTKPEPLPNFSQPESSLSVRTSETLDLPIMATAMGEYIDSIIKERQRRSDLPNASRNPIEESATQSNFPSSALIGTGDFTTPAINYPSPPGQNLAELLRVIPVDTMVQFPAMEPSATFPSLNCRLHLRLNLRKLYGVMASILWKRRKHKRWNRLDQVRHYQRLRLVWP